MQPIQSEIVSFPKEYAADKDCEIVRKFVDEAESARTANRPAFQEMISLAKAKPKPFDAILVWKLPRFARNREDSIIYKSLLRKRGVLIISINERVDDSPAGALFEGMIELIDEFYSANLAQDKKRGLNKPNSTGSMLPSKMVNCSCRISLLGSSRCDPSLTRSTLP